ncbi:LEA type 2 family protein [Chitinilyticum litopenaei]|uniref:LEA type 2 family protein n=1 Tax=Chitinilyticum litopenaei TaxID=1121276 RepID=UPI0003FD6556|nr:LEA type 2 family protein [Chitinilyticum litopenaei]
MLNTLRTLLVVLSAFLLGACSTTTGPLQKPQVNIAGLSLEELGLFEQRFELRLRISNPNSFALPMEGLKAQLEINGQPFAEGLSNEKVSLRGLADTEVKVRVTTNLGSALKTLNKLLASRTPLQYRTAGTLYLPLVPGGLPFERKGELTLSDARNK